MNQCRCGVTWDPAVQAHRYCNIKESTQKLNRGLRAEDFVVGIESKTERTAQISPDSKLTVEVALQEAARCRGYPDRVLNEEVVVVLADALVRLRADS